MKLTPHVLLATSLLGCMPASAEATGLLFGKLPGDDLLDKATSAYKLYADENNPVLQEFSLQGMAQLQWAEVHNDGKHYAMDDVQDSKKPNARENYWGEDIEARRLRLGIKSKWFNCLKLDGNLDLDPNFSYGAKDPDLLRGYAKQILDLYVTYSTSDDFSFLIGKREAKFGREQEISSKEIITFERGMLANTLYPGELAGVWVKGKGIADHWFYEAGVYDNERKVGFSDFKSESGTIYLGKFGYDYAGMFGTDTAEVGVHYLHNSGPGDNFGNYGATPKFSDSVSLYTDLTAGRFGLVSEVLWGEGAVGQSNVTGLSVIPSYFIYDGLQLVAQLQIAKSERQDGLSLPSRYESVVPAFNAATVDSKGDTYEAAYLGLNYYLNGHKSKLMAGVEWSTLEGKDGDAKRDFNGYTLLAGYRMSF